MTPTPQAIERASQNIYTATPRNRPYEQLSLAKKNALRAQATKVLTGDLGDMVLVPRATFERVVRIAGRCEADPAIDDARAMIAAAEGERCK